MISRLISERYDLHEWNGVAFSFASIDNVKADIESIF